MNTPTSQETVAKLRQSLRRWGVFGWGVGVLVVLAGVGLAVSPALWSGSTRTEGTVIKLEPAAELIQHGYGSAQAGDIVWYEEVMVNYPVVEYQADNQKFTFRPRSSFQTYTVGQKVPILYRVDRPGVARLDTFADRWLAPLLVGGVLLVLGVVIMAGAAFSQRMFRHLEANLTPEDRAAREREGPAPSAPGSAS